MDIQERRLSSIIRERDAEITRLRAALEAIGATKPDPEFSDLWAADAYAIARQALTRED